MPWTTTGVICQAYAYTAHELHEDIEPIIHLKQAKLAGDSLALALDTAHAVAYHSGLGEPLYPTAATTLSGYLNEHSAADFAETVYAKPNIAVVADGASQAALSRWVEMFFKAVPSSPAGKLSLSTTPSKYYGGEQRTASATGNAVVIAFPSSAIGSAKPETAVLAALLGGSSSISWTPGFTLLSKAAASAPGALVAASTLAYSDAGLLAIQISGPAEAVRKAAGEAVKAVKAVAEGSLSKEDVTKAIAKAKFDALTANELSGAGLTYTGTSILHGAKPFQVADTVKSLESVTADKVKAVRSIPHPRCNLLRV